MQKKLHALKMDILVMFSVNGWHYLETNPIGYVNVTEGRYEDPNQTFNIVQEEWLPEQVQLNDLRGERQIIAANGETVSFVTKEDGMLVFEADGTSDSYLIPLLWYKGYRATIQTETGAEMSMTLSEEEVTGKILLSLDPGVTGTISVWYEGTMIQKVTDLVTLVTWIGVAVYVGKKRYTLSGRAQKKADSV